MYFDIPVCMYACFVIVGIDAYFIVQLVTNHYDWTVQAPVFLFLFFLSNHRPIMTNHMHRVILCLIPGFVWNVCVMFCFCHAVCIFTVRYKCIFCCHFSGAAPCTFVVTVQNKTPFHPLIVVDKFACSAGQLYCYYFVITTATVLLTVAWLMAQTARPTARDVKEVKQCVAKPIS